MIISRAPVRLSMGGGGTDLPSYYEKYGGFLIAATINKYIYVMANERHDDSIRLSYSKTEIVQNVNNIQHNIFREALKNIGIEKKIELVSVADVTSQCGLGTSSAFTIALLNALYSYQKKYLSLEQLAEIACRLEIEILNEPIGKQDQYSAAFGGFNAYWFNKDGTVTIEPINISNEKLSELQNNLLLFYLNIERPTRTVLEIQNNKSKEGDQETLERLHKIKSIGMYTKKVFESGNTNDFGEILHEHWMTKKGLSNKITTPFIDEVYETARNNGAIGGKLVGAGGGGFLLLYCPKNKSTLINAMAKFNIEPMWFYFEQEGARIVFNS